MSENLKTMYAESICKKMGLNNKAIITLKNIYESDTLKYASETLKLLTDSNISKMNNRAKVTLYYCNKSAQLIGEKQNFTTLDLNSLIDNSFKVKDFKVNTYKPKPRTITKEEIDKKEYTKKMESEAYVIDQIHILKKRFSEIPQDYKYPTLCRIVNLAMFNLKDRFIEAFGKLDYDASDYMVFISNTITQLDKDNIDSSFLGSSKSLNRSTIRAFASWELVRFGNKSSLKNEKVYSSIKAGELPANGLIGNIC